MALPADSNLGFLLCKDLHIYKSFEQLKKLINLNLLATEKKNAMQYMCYFIPGKGNENIGG